MSQQISQFQPFYRTPFLFARANLRPVPCRFSSCFPCGVLNCWKRVNGVDLAKSGRKESSATDGSFLVSPSFHKIHKPFDPFPKLILYRTCITTKGTTWFSLHSAYGFYKPLIVWFSTETAPPARKQKAAAIPRKYGSL